MLTKIDIRLKDNNGTIRKTLENLKTELDLSSYNEVIEFLIHKYNNLVFNLPVTYEPREVYEITYSDGSKTIMLLTKKELIDFKKSVHYSAFTNEDVLVKEAIKTS